MANTRNVFIAVGNVSNDYKYFFYPEKDSKQGGMDFQTELNVPHVKNKDPPYHPGSVLENNEGRFFTKVLLPQPWEPALVSTNT